MTSARLVLRSNQLNYHADWKLVICELSINPVGGKRMKVNI